MYHQCIWRCEWYIIGLNTHKHIYSVFCFLLYCLLLFVCEWHTTKHTYIALCRIIYAIEMLGFYFLNLSTHKQRYIYIFTLYWVTLHHTVFAYYNDKRAKKKWNDGETVEGRSIISSNKYNMRPLSETLASSALICEWKHFHLVHCACVYLVIEMNKQPRTYVRVWDGNQTLERHDKVVYIRLIYV